MGRLGLLLCGWVFLLVKWILVLSGSIWCIWSWAMLGVWMVVVLGYILVLDSVH